eukprot:3516679-Amphidinium_carterae.1
MSEVSRWLPNIFCEVNAPNGGAATVPHAAVSSSAPALPELPSPTALHAVGVSGLKFCDSVADEIATGIGG